MIPYSARILDDRGRMYAHGDLAQRLPRGFRLLLCGDTHVELDVTGAFYELTRRLAQSRLGWGGTGGAVSRGFNMEVQKRRKFWGPPCRPGNYKRRVGKAQGPALRLAQSNARESQGS